MRAVPALLVMLALLLVAPTVLAAEPRAMNFNGQASADVKGPIRDVAIDGPGRWGAVAVADAGTQSLLTEDQDLFVYNLASEAQAWQARDEDLVNEGARLVAVANGTSGSPGDWALLVNNSASSIVSVYRTSGFGGGVLGRLVWQVDPIQGPINDIDISADGRLFALATGGAAANKSYILYQNNFEQQQPRQLFKYQINATDTSVSLFTAVALSQNSTVPPTPANRSVYTIVGAETLSANLIRGQVWVFESIFTPDLERPATRQVLTFDTNTPVTRVAITADGEYAVAGTADGQIYLVSVSEALLRKGATGIQTQLRPWQGSLGANITALDIATFGGEFFAAGTDTGEVVLFRNRFGPSGSEGAQAVQAGRTSVAACPTPRQAPVRSLVIGDAGDQLVVGAKDGIVAYEAAAHARYGTGAFEPAWCVAMPAADVGDGVRVALSGDGMKVFAGSGHRVFGYKNFHQLAVSVDEPRKAGTPGQRLQWQVTVRNEGSLFDRVQLAIVGPQDPGWDFSFSNQSLSLMPGRSQTVLLNVTSPPDREPGNVTLTLNAIPERAAALQGTGTAQVSTQLRLELGQLRRVELRPPAGILVASAGAETKFPITVYNGGNAPDRFRISAEIPEPQQNHKSPGSDWLIRADDPNPNESDAVIEIPARSEGIIELLVTPLTANRGDSVTIRLTAEAEVPDAEGFFASDTQQVTVAVEPSYNGDIALAETKDLRVEPGAMLFINFTVKNLGNSQDIFVVENRTEPANAPGWKLQLSDERFELKRQNQQHTVRLTVGAQQGLQPGQTVRIVVDLFSEGLMKQVPGSDGKVDTQTVTVTAVPQAKRGLFAPVAPEPLVFLGVALAALAARRRWEGA